MKTSAPLLLPLLRTKTQGDLYARLFLDTDMVYSISELAAAVGASVSQTLREVNRLEEAGLVTTTRRGHSRLITVDTSNPVYEPLSALLAVTFGAVSVITDLLTGVDGIDEAFIFGSWAARYHERPGAVPGDVDVMVIGDTDRDVLYDLGVQAGRTLRREVNIRRFKRDVWDSESNGAFRRTVLGRPIVPLLGTSGVGR